MEYLDGYITTMRHVVRKVAVMKSRLYGWKTISLLGYNFQMSGLGI